MLFVAAKLLATTALSETRMRPRLLSERQLQQWTMQPFFSPASNSRQKGIMVVNGLRVHKSVSFTLRNVFDLTPCLPVFLQGLGSRGQSIVRIKHIVPQGANCYRSTTEIPSQLQKTIPVHFSQTNEIQTKKSIKESAFQIPV